MSLEHDIRQRVFRNEYQKAILNILYTQNHLVNAMSMVFKRFHITRQQYNVLRILRGQYPEPAPINLIKDRMLEKMSDTSRIVERLRIKGLVQRSHGTSDKRSSEIKITPEGLDLLKVMRGPVDEFESVLVNLSAAEAQELNYLLDKIRVVKFHKEKDIVTRVETADQPEKF